MLRPLDAVPFPTAIEALTDYKVLELDLTDDGDQRFLDGLGKGANQAAIQARAEGIYTARPNEAGNEIEKFAITALIGEGFQAGIPLCRSGKARSAGYPDIRVSDGVRTVYIDCKTYNAKSEDTTLRSFW